VAHYDATVGWVLGARQRLLDRTHNQDPRNDDRNSDDDHRDHGLMDGQTIYADDGGGAIPLDQLFK